MLLSCNYVPFELLLSYNKFVVYECEFCRSEKKGGWSTSHPGHLHVDIQCFLLCHQSTSPCDPSLPLTDPNKSHSSCLNLTNPTQKATSTSQSKAVPRVMTSTDSKAENGHSASAIKPFVSKKPVRVAEIKCRQ